MMRLIAGPNVLLGDCELRSASKSPSVSGINSIPDILVVDPMQRVLNAAGERNYAAFVTVIEVKKKLTYAPMNEGLAQLRVCGTAMVQAGRTGTLMGAVTDLKRICFLSMRLGNGQCSEFKLAEPLPLLREKSPVECNTVVFPDGEATPGFNALCALFSEEAIAANWQ